MAAIISNNTQGSTEATQLAVKADLDQIVTNTANSAPTSSFIHSDTLSTVTPGATQDAGAGNLVKTYSIVVKGTGAAPTLSTVNLEVSLDGTNWTVLLTASQVLDGTITSTGSVLFPSRYFRSNVTTLTLGGASNVVVTVAAMK